MNINYKDTPFPYFYGSLDKKMYDYAHKEERFDDIPYCKDCDQLYHVPESLVWTNMKNRKYKQSKVLDTLEIQ